MFPVIVGAALMTVLAAFFEAFWSASTIIPVAVKYGVGTCCWLLVIAFFVFSGRATRAWNCTRTTAIPSATPRASTR